MTQIRKMPSTQQTRSMNGLGRLPSEENSDMKWIVDMDIRHLCTCNEDVDLGRKDEVSSGQTHSFDIP